MKKEKKETNKILLIILLVLVGITVLMIPLLYISEVKRILPIMAFIVLPIILGGIIFLLSRNCIKEYENKKKRILKKLGK